MKVDAENWEKSYQQFTIIIFEWNTPEGNLEGNLENFVNGRASVDIKETVSEFKNIISSLQAAHALSGCDFVAPL